MLISIDTLQMICLAVEVGVVVAVVAVAVVEEV